MAIKLYVYGTLSTMYMYEWSKQMVILCFKNLLFLFLVDFKLWKSSLTNTAACMMLLNLYLSSCFVYTLTA